MNLNNPVQISIRRNTLWLLRLMALWLYLVSIPSYANPLAGYCITKQGQSLSRLLHHQTRPKAASS